MLFILISQIYPILSYSVNQDTYVEDVAPTSGIEYFIIGWILFIIAFPLLWYNERRYLFTKRRHIKSQRVITSGMKHCESANCLELNPNQQGRLIHVTGNTETDRLIVDSQFGLSEANCVKLIRNVEMFQWVEETHTSNKKKTYKYTKKWRDTYQNSNGFRHTGYDNNKSNWIIEKTTNVNPSVKLGVYELSENLKAQCNKKELTTLSQNNIEICQQYYSQYNISLEDSYIYFRQSRIQDSVGDLRIQFYSVSTGPTTIVARQLGNDLVSFSFQNTLGKQYSIQQEKESDDLELPSECLCCCDCMRKLEEPIQNIEWLFDGILTKKQANKNQPTYYSDILQLYQKSFNCTFRIVQSFELVDYYHSHILNKIFENLMYNVLNPLICTQQMERSLHVIVNFKEIQQNNLLHILIQNHSNELIELCKQQASQKQQIHNIFKESRQLLQIIDLIV